MEPELIVDYACETGEGPLWHPDEKRVYWVDIPQGRLFRYEPSTGRHELCHQESVIGGFTIQADGGLLLFLDKGTVKKWREGKTETVVDGIPDEKESRFNDVIADPEGRVYCGTMPTPERQGRLYRLDLDGSLKVMDEGFGCPNGMGFALDGKSMYFIDSPARKIYLYDYDRATGALAHRRDFVDTSEDPGFPDGMTVDSLGFVWCAKWDGSCVVRYTPDGREDRRIALPARKVSSLAFGGEAYDELYVTTAGGRQKDTDGAMAGGLFRLRPGVRGLPEFRSRI